MFMITQLSSSNAQEMPCSSHKNICRMLYEWKELDDLSDVKRRWVVIYVHGRSLISKKAFLLVF